MIQITKNTKVYIWANTKQALGGGSEVLNMLAATLKKFGGKAWLFNYAYNQYFIRNKYFSNLYDVDTIGADYIEDSEDNVFVLPEMLVDNFEIFEMFKTRFKKSKFMIWWLGTGRQNFAPESTSLSFANIFNYLRQYNDRMMHLCESECALKNIKHYSPGAPILKFQHGINNQFFSVPKKCEKENIVLYNAIKGKTRWYVENYLIPNAPDIKFRHIDFIDEEHHKTKEQMCEIYDKAKVYVDFCEFDGREMCPREAAYRKCILYVDNDTNAATFEDYPIPNYYKLDKFQDDPNDILDKIRKSLENYDDELNNFQFFRNKVKSEPIYFFFNVINLFGPMLDEKLIEKYAPDFTSCYTRSAVQ